MFDSLARPSTAAGASFAHLWNEIRHFLPAGRPLPDEDQRCCSDQSAHRIPLPVDSRWVEPSVRPNLGADVDGTVTRM